MRLDIIRGARAADPKILAEADFPIEPGHAGEKDPYLLYVLHQASLLGAGVIRQPAGRIGRIGAFVLATDQQGGCTVREFLSVFEAHEAFLVARESVTVPDQAVDNLTLGFNVGLPGGLGDGTATG
jgi:hypothetical protein